VLPLLEQLKALGFGALFGGGVLGLLFAMFPRLFPGITDLQSIMLVGGALGAGLHRGVETYVIGGIFRPIASFASYYAKMAQLSALVRLGAIPETQASRLLKAATDAYFSGRRVPNPALPPPG
jgi:hypothetical protein